MTKKLWVATGLLCLAAAGAVAQEHQQHQQQQQAGPSAEQQAAMMAAMSPNENHKRLEPFAGTFDAKVSFWQAPGTDPVVSEGVSVNKWVMGGRYLEQRFTSSLMGMPFEGLGYTGYDNMKKQYWGTWIDSMSTGVMTTTGNTTDAGKSYTFTAKMSDPMSGKESTVQEKTIVESNDRHRFEMWGEGPDGRTFKMMEIVYTRKK